jgi:hypothetical protein
MSEVILVLSVLIFILTILYLKKSKKSDIIHRPRTSVSSEYLQRSVADVRIQSAQHNDQKNDNMRMTTPNTKYKCDNLNNYNYQIMNFYTPITEEKISYIINNNNKNETFQPQTEIKQEEKNEEEQLKPTNKPTEDIATNNCTYKVLKLSDYLNNETSNFIIDLDDVTNSLSKYHQFNKIDMNHINIPLSDLIPRQINLENVR